MSKMKPVINASYPKVGWFRNRFIFVSTPWGVEVWDHVRGVVFGRFDSFEEAKREVDEWIRIHEYLRKRMYGEVPV